MPVQPFKMVEPGMTHEQLLEEVARLQRLLKNLINGSLDFENIVARGIKAENIETGTLTANEIAANTITADKMNVTELSAIVANLGTITAGILNAVSIFGSYIATKNGTYPRAELNSTDDLIRAMSTATNYVALTPSILGSPALYYNDGTIEAGIFTFAFANQMTIYSNTHISLGPGTGFYVKVPDWDRLYSTGDSQTLQAALDGLTTSINNLTAQLATKATAGSSTSTNGTHNHGIADGTQLLDADGVTVHTFFSSGSHSHTQN